MIFFILIGAEIFSKFLAISRIPVATTQYVAQLNMSPMVILTFILIVYFILGLFLEGLAIFVLTLLVVYPLITFFGFDGVCFGVVMVLVMNIVLITPLFGLSVYIIAGVVINIPVYHFFNGVILML